MAKSRARSVSQTPKPAPPPWRNLSRRALIAAAVLTFLAAGMALALQTADQPAPALSKPTNVAATVSGSTNTVILMWGPGRGRPRGGAVHVGRRTPGHPLRASATSHLEVDYHLAKASCIAVVIAFDANGDPGTLYAPRSAL